jgi:hypothetical protein
MQCMYTYIIYICILYMFVALILAIYFLDYLLSNDFKGKTKSG